MKLLPATIAVAVTLAFLPGCNKGASDANADNSQPQGTTQSPAGNGGQGQNSAGQNLAKGGGGGDTVHPLGPNVGGVTPVTGGENMDTTGGGLVSSIKNKAKQVGAKESAGTLSQLPKDDSN